MSDRIVKTGRALPKSTQVMRFPSEMTDSEALREILESQRLPASSTRTSAILLGPDGRPLPLPEPQADRGQFVSLFAWATYATAQ